MITDVGVNFSDISVYEACFLSIMLIPSPANTIQIPSLLAC
jgi:hypothetical protein